jgi:hypothetical protein
MSPSEILARVRRLNRKRQPRVIIHLYVFTNDNRIPVEISQ